MAQNFLTSSRHGTVFYFRRRVPGDLRTAIRKPFLLKTLATAHRPTAVALARAYAAHSDRVFQYLRAMKKADPEEFLQFNYEYSIELNEDGSAKSIKMNATPEEQLAADASLQGALQRLSKHGSVVASSASPKSAQTSPAALLDDFFREGAGSGRWKNAEKIRTHDYDPIWSKFSVHADRHGLTLEAAKAYRAEVLEQPAAYATKVRNLSRVHSVIVHGAEHFALDPLMLKQLKMPKVKGHNKNSRTNSYLPFDDDDLKRLFHSDAYQANSFKKPSHYWLPLLGLYSGARLEELAGLHLSVFFDTDGIPSMTLSDGDTTDGGKNEHAERKVPIHPELLKAGLLQYVDQMRSEGHQRLFPDIRAAKRDGYGKRATTDFTDYRRSVGVGRDSGERSRKVFHSFRSTLSVKLYQLGVDGDLSRRLTGHAAIDVHQGTYLAAAAIPLRLAANEVARITFGLTHPPFKDTAAYVKARNRKQSANSAEE